ncbi:hypothetical protein PYW08_011362 [Mythimna loreyi]|uniref:Uncharacterized protein n=1 Tax=Mythimna loreyi TaxID=667449 RepID=A0ACC2Q327_9NEOP|nr:hypothetical protein PYW08_011362 [Mythimna loreyi]
MTAFETYIFLDLKTHSENHRNVPRITELGMLAIKRRHFLMTRPDEELRVQYRFRMCFNLPKTLSDRSWANEEPRELEAELNTEACESICSFINSLQKPACIIAHDGFAFQFPVLKDYFIRNSKELSEVKFTDSLYAFYDFLQIKNPGGGGEKTFKEYRKREPFEELISERLKKPEEFPADSYRLKDIYTRVKGGPDLVGNVEDNCTMIMKIGHRQAERFSTWVAENNGGYEDIHCWCWLAYRRRSKSPKPRNHPNSIRQRLERLQQKLPKREILF